MPGYLGAVWRKDPVDRLATTEEIDIHVGARLRARRLVLGLSQGALGRELGITFSQVQKYEKGSNRIGAGRLYRLAVLLDVPVQYFFETADKAKARRSSREDAIVAAEAEQLRDTYRAIADPQARHALLSLAKSLVEDG